MPCSRLVEKERTCVPHGDAGATGVFPADAASVRDAVEGCASPPEGFEEAWCSARAARCERHPGECDDDDVSSCKDPGPGAGGDPAEDPDRDHASVSCSASAGRGASSGWALPAIGLALSLASRARRRRERR
ncbi:hypothetical protein [Sorangium sp. So ce1078]|uniref:hypothetical protein n=1 Tax=Sorangium sp. So ce1078 TaxID=3133329 RepID=UPI003F61AFE5